MAHLPETTAELADVLATPVSFDFDLPDPADPTLDHSEFQRRLDNAWQQCDRIDLRTDIWRGRILRTVRDREKLGGDARGAGFSEWLKRREITKSRAYSLIQLANSADTLLSAGDLPAEAIGNFSKRAFVETAKAAPEVQRLISKAARDRGARITRREVKQLSDEWTAMSSDLLPPQVKQKAGEGTLPARHLAPLVKEMEKLPPAHVREIQREIQEHPNTDTAKHLASEARTLSRYLDAAARVQAIRNCKVDMELALDEALQLGCLNLTSDLVKQAAQLEQATARLFALWKRLGNLSDRLYVDTGASNPHLRALLGCLDVLTNDTIEVPLDDSGDRLVRLRVLPDA
ncbi:hypothetical protein KR51_00019520 [Rubidibacter lacunae KORDI 51-2]|uniref:DUF3102 domain-containing protein n=1 Tax=Rubidibacter lacunae KORDI 51-2 TaxID=582515 RepID=U5DLC9_9CHRO|nr:hypothetical protein [Rubidibacter lacunae]ERN41384.1 hypothetical protein KR51_00019520 [Rubidibacter lacunae KORDI 51-2]